MKFWKENKVANEFDWPVDAVADAFMMRWHEHDLGHAPFPLEHMLRSWLTATDGFNSVWEAETGPDSFEELYNLVAGHTHAITCRCGYQASDADDLDQHVLASMHLTGDHG
jgi:hypothetical protein